VVEGLGLTTIHTTRTLATGVLGDVAPEAVVAACVHADVPVVGFRVARPTLEDVFVSLTGEGFDVSG
jgi:ABC-2 type transport system ATP-binding protein